MWPRTKLIHADHRTSCGWSRKRGHQFRIYDVRNRLKPSHYMFQLTSSRIIQRAMPLHKRPVYMSSFSATFGIATVVAPLVGGALTTHVTWRAVFFINIPFGVLSALIIIFHFSDLGTFNRLSSLPTLQKMKRLDTIGTILLLGQATCLLLSLQIASSTRTWSNPRVIGLLVASGVLLAAFVALQAFEKENGILPLRFLRKRSMAGAMVFVATTGAAMNVFEYYVSYDSLASYSSN
jgi:MFS family permease